MSGKEIWQHSGILSAYCEAGSLQMYTAEEDYPLDSKGVPVKASTSMGSEPDTRSKIERFWDDSKPVAWAVVIIAMSTAIWAWHQPITGLSIGLLALMAGIVSLRPRMHFAEKIAWVLVLTAFAAFEVVAIKNSDAASTTDKKALVISLTAIQKKLDKTLSQLNVVHDGIAEMASNKPYLPPTRPALRPKPPEKTKPGSNEHLLGKRFVDAEKLGLSLSNTEPSSASVWNDGTNEAGNFANQLVVGLRDGKWVAGGNNLKMGDPQFFPDHLTLEISSLKASPEDHSIEEAKILQKALAQQGVSAVIRYTQQAFPANFMRVKVSGQ